MKLKYTAYDSRGQKTSGRLDAPNIKAAAAALSAQKLTPTSVTEDKSPLNFYLWFSGRMGVSATDKANLTRQLATMVTAGLSLTDALNLLGLQANYNLAGPMGTILEDVSAGSSLSAAMAKHPQIFSPVYVALVKAGEAAGVLEKVLARLADSLEKNRDFQAKVKGAMIYPAIIIVGMIAVMIVMMVVVIPKLTSLYTEFGATLPIMTQVVIGTSQFMVRWWWLVVGAILSGVAGLRLYLARLAGRRWWDGVIYRLPVVGSLAQTVMLAEMTRTLALLLGAGISIVEALGIVSAVVGNAVVEGQLRQIAGQVEKGLPVSVSFAQSESFPPIVGQMLAVGEETGKMDEVLAKLSGYYESEAENRVKGLTTAIEPLIIVLLGVGVGLLIFSVMMPIYNLTSQFS